MTPKLALAIAMMFAALRMPNYAPTNGPDDSERREEMATMFGPLSLLGSERIAMATTPRSVSRPMQATIPATMSRTLVGGGSGERVEGGQSC
jgi:hypothetical protein